MLTPMGCYIWSGSPPRRLGMLCGFCAHMQWPRREHLYKLALNMGGTESQSNVDRMGRHAKGRQAGKQTCLGLSLMLLTFGGFAPTGTGSSEGASQYWPGAHRWAHKILPGTLWISAGVAPQRPISPC